MLGLLGLLVGLTCVSMCTRMPIRHYHADELSGVFFANRKAYPGAMFSPGMAGMGLFVLLPSGLLHCLHQPAALTS